jgi:hypothetical protein
VRFVLAAASLAIIHPDKTLQWAAVLVGGAAVLAVWKLLAPTAELAHNAATTNRGDSKT